MNLLASECSSGCESGWTSYLEQSFLSGNLLHKSNGFNDKKSGFCDGYKKDKGKEEAVYDDEDDLSMVSDASSGPPHFYEDKGYFNDDNHDQYIVPKVSSLNKNGGKIHRNKEHQRQREDHQELSSLLDDTASSPLINFSKNNFAHTNGNNHASMEESVFHYPQGFSATHFQGGPAFQDHFDFLQSSSSGNHLRGHQWF